MGMKSFSSTFSGIYVKTLLFETSMIKLDVCNRLWMEKGYFNPPWKYGELKAFIRTDILGWQEQANQWTETDQDESIVTTSVCMSVQLHLPQSKSGQEFIESSKCNQL